MIPRTALTVNDEWNFSVVPLLPRYRNGHRVAVAPTLEPRLTRRTVLQAGAAAIGLSALRPSAADANPLVWVARTAFAAAIGWFVERALDHVARKRFESEASLNDARSTPSRGRDRFHDTYASPYEVSRYSYTYPQRYSEPIGYHWSLNGYLRATHIPRGKIGTFECCDYNPTELITLQQWDSQESLDGIYYPTTARFARNDRISQDIVRSTLKTQYENVDPDEWRIDYSRNMGRKGTESQLAYGIKNRRDPKQKSLIIVQS